VSDCSYVRVKIVIKELNTQNGVFGGVTRTNGGQNWSNNRKIVKYIYRTPQDIKNHNETYLIYIYCKNKSI
jgi:hypothetical protein